MRSNKLGIAGLMAVAALAASGSAIAVPRQTWKRPPVQKLPNPATTEIELWNAAVDAKKAKKKGEKP